jgi:hypothetical protein
LTRNIGPAWYEFGQRVELLGERFDDAEQLEGLEVVR